LDQIYLRLSCPPFSSSVNSINVSGMEASRVS
jgi:hypothetical protein